ncbi:hypothetical protein GCM10009865_52720 [Aeromicrobium ponti]|uniref:YfhD-like protein n=1 Tax=Cytobacillus oceanisediminis TaxID=665099 RepID=A0A562J5Q2_9BACI|nr:hypothetical protein [Cytobacillus oceanisediminis]TWH78522.1 hypothetical protein IQ19_05286 [Cytobacillus oceanisediminis]
MAKNKKNRSEHQNNALPKDVEFADDRANGLERIALKAQREHRK